MDMIATIFDIASSFRRVATAFRVASSGRSHLYDERLPRNATACCVPSPSKIRWARVLGLEAGGDLLLALRQHFGLPVQLGVGARLLLEKPPKRVFAGEPVHRQVVARPAEAAKELGAEEALRVREQACPGTVVGIRARTRLRGPRRPRTARPSCTRGQPPARPSEA